MNKIAHIKLRRFGHVETFVCRNERIEQGELYVISFGRGQDYGKVLLVEETEEIQVPDKQNIIRKCSENDLERIRGNESDAEKNIKLCQQEINSRNMKMKLIEAEYTFDRSKIVYYFAADHRIDFRELVKDLAKKYKIRIELRQIGIRDETKVIGGIGCCGRACCCNSWIKEFSSVNIRMAKIQQVQLHPSKLSGVCGKLKCCLAYEYSCYREAQTELPKKGQRVRTPKGPGDVVSVELLSKKVKVYIEEIGAETFAGDEVTVISRSKSRAKSRAKKRRSNEAPVNRASQREQSDKTGRRKQQLKAKPKNQKVNK